jgi:hypothetical protein
MPSIKSTLKLESTTLFPSPVTITVVGTEQVNGNADFQTVVIPANGTDALLPILTQADASSTVYFYAQALSTNSGSVEVYSTDSADNTAYIGILRPGDFMWLPVAATGQGVTISGTNTSGASTAVVNVFWGSRG